jgi:hypothetical protein
MRKLFVVIVACALVPFAHAASITPRLDLVVALDLSKSVDVKGPDGKTEFQKDVDGVAQVLAQIPAASHVTVVGITDHSFTQPYILLSASVPNDPGYFGERLATARGQLVHAWEQRSTKLQPRFFATDILGALDLASEIFNLRAVNGDRRVLILFSDMRNDNDDLDLETSTGVARAAKQKSPLLETTPDLHGVEVFALGVDGAGSKAVNWHKIEEFWKRYFAISGTASDTFSVLRQRPSYGLDRFASQRTF